jgi:DNA-directed RNA polymerase specialized sigma24 family protein
MSKKPNPTKRQPTRASAKPRKARTGKSEDAIEAARTGRDGELAASMGADEGVGPPASAAERAQLRLLVERNYKELHAIASRKLRTSALRRTMSPTSLVAEGVVRLMKQRALPKTSPHLGGLATILMAQALSDRAKHRRASKRAGNAHCLRLGTDVPHDKRLGRGGERPKAEERSQVQQHELLAGLEALGREHPRQMEIVALHLVLGIPLVEVARMVKVSERTAFRALAAGRAALALALGLGGAVFEPRKRRS